MVTLLEKERRAVNEVGTRDAVESKMSERTPRVSKPTPKGVELQAIRAAAAEKARKAAATRKLRATTKSEALKEPRSLKTKADKLQGDAKLQHGSTMHDNHLKRKEPDLEEREATPHENMIPKPKRVRANDMSNMPTGTVAQIGLQVTNPPMPTNITSPGTPDTSTDAKDVDQENTELHTDGPPLNIYTPAQSELLSADIQQYRGRPSLETQDEWRQQRIDYLRLLLLTLPSALPIAVPQDYPAWDGAPSFDEEDLDSFGWGGCFKRWFDTVFRSRHLWMDLPQIAADDNRHTRAFAASLVSADDARDIDSSILWSRGQAAQGLITVFRQSFLLCPPNDGVGNLEQWLCDIITLAKQTYIRFRCKIPQPPYVSNTLPDSSVSPLSLTVQGLDSQIGLRDPQRTHPHHPRTLLGPDSVCDTSLSEPFSEPAPRLHRKIIPAITQYDTEIEESEDDGSSYSRNSRNDPNSGLQSLVDAEDDDTEDDNIVEDDAPSGTYKKGKRKGAKIAGRAHSGIRGTTVPKPSHSQRLERAIDPNKNDADRQRTLSTLSSALLDDDEDLVQRLTDNLQVRNDEDDESDNELPGDHSSSHLTNAQRQICTSICRQHIELIDHFSQEWNVSRELILKLGGWLPKPRRGKSAFNAFQSQSKGRRPPDMKVQDWTRTLKAEYDALFADMTTLESAAKREELSNWLVESHGNEDRLKCEKGIRASLMVRTRKELTDQSAHLWKYSRIAMITFLINAEVTDGDATMQNGLISPCDAISKVFEGRQKSVALDMRKIVHEANGQMMREEEGQADNKGLEDQEAMKRDRQSGRHLLAEFIRGLFSAKGIALSNGTSKEQTPMNLLPHHLYINRCRIINWPEGLDAPYPSRPGYKQSELVSAIDHILDPVLCARTTIEKWSNEDINLPDSQQGHVGLIYSQDHDAPPLRTVSCVSKWVRKYSQDMAFSNNTRSDSVLVTTAVPQGSPLAATLPLRSHLGALPSSRLPLAAVASQKSHYTTSHPTLSNADTRPSGNKPLAGGPTDRPSPQQRGQETRDVGSSSRHPQLSSQSLADLQSRAINNMPKFNALVRSSDRSNAKLKRMKQRDEIDELKRIVEDLQRSVTPALPSSSQHLDISSFRQHDNFSGRSQYATIRPSSIPEGYEQDCERDHKRDGERDHERDGERDHERDGEQDHEQDGKRDHERDGKRDHERDGKRDRERDDEPGRKRDREQDREQDHKRGRERDREQDHERGHERDRKQDHEQDHEPDREHRWGAIRRDGSRVIPPSRFNNLTRHAYDDPIKQFNRQVNVDAQPQRYFRTNQQDDDTPSYVSHFGRYQQYQHSEPSSSNDSNLRRNTPLYAPGKPSVPDRREKSQSQSQHLW